MRRSKALTALPSWLTLGVILCTSTPAFVLAAPQKAAAQEKPISAIDWLSDSLDTPRKTDLSTTLKPARPTATPSTTKDISTNALPQDVTVSALGALRVDSVGLLPTSQTGLPHDLWGTSSALDLSRRITSIAAQTNLLPASRRLLNTLLLAELAPPAGFEHEGRLFLARIDALLAQGLLDEADALMQRAGVQDPDIFRRFFDTKLLLGTEDEACSQLRSSAHLSPSLQTRVFCLARDGDWKTAALTLETADTLGLIPPEDSLLLSRFLDPELAENAAEKILPPTQPTPLTFRLLDAIGEPISTRTLPLAFVQSDLRDSAGWKIRAAAAERLARVGAITPNKWLGVWSEHLPAASGGIWDRMEALQRFETALTTGDPGAISTGLPLVWTEMGKAGLQTLFAALFAERLENVPLSGSAIAIGQQVSLLSPAYETLANSWTQTAGAFDPQTAFLHAVAVGDLVTSQPQSAPKSAKERAIYDGFTASGIPVRLQTLVNDKRLGEAILRALELLEGGAAGDLDELSDAIQFFKAAGLEETARRAALEILLLERRG
jgi:hypothetical protein